MTIKLFQMYDENDKFITDAILNILSTCMKADFILGKNVTELEHRLAKEVDRKYCITCASGSDALYLALRACGVPTGSKIITTPFTFIATGDSILRAGLVPVFVDVDPYTFNIDASQVEIAIKETPCVRGIVPVNIFGMPCDYSQLNKLAKDNHLYLIEDAAQSFGASVNGEMSCSFGDCSCTSFFPTKPLGCFGDGGAVFTDNSEIDSIIRKLRKHGQGDLLGVNSRLDTIQAGVLLAKLNYVKQSTLKRRKIFEIYNEKLRKDIVTQRVPRGYNSACSIFSIIVSNREQIMTELLKKGVESKIYYNTPLIDMKVFGGSCCGEFKYTKFICEHILSIPAHEYLVESDLEIVINTINNIAVPATIK